MADEEEHISIDVPKDLYLEFKKNAAIKYKFKKGFIQLALIQAMNYFIEIEKVE